MVDINEVAERILAQRRLVPPGRSLLVGVSGIDGSGKGFVTRQLEARITQNSIATANINVDGWLNLPDRRFGSINPGEHFYKNAIRFDELFSKLLLPLRDHQSVDLAADFAEETARSYRRHTYSFRNVAVVLVEGIFLFKREHFQHFDLRIWVDCSFSSALARALARKQEGLPPAATIRAYDRIYFPAQRIHLDRNHPRESADLLVNNDTYSFTWPTLVRVPQFPPASRLYRSAGG